LPGEYVLLRRDLSRFISSDIPVDWAAFCTELRRLHRDICGICRIFRVTFSTL